MALRFIGGPYDGMEIDHKLINKYAHLTPISGDVGFRTFVLVPDNREVWEKMVRGEDVKPDKLFPYERVLTAGGGFFVASPPGTLDSALSQAKLKLSSRAKIALDALPSEDRRRVIEAADSLQYRSPDEWPQDKVVSIDNGKGVYLLRATPELRAFIHVLDGGQIELVDLVGKDALQLFTKQYQDAGVPK